MVDRPILFSGEMIRAILDGRKTMTRRVCVQLSTDPDRNFTLIDGAVWTEVYKQELADTAPSTTVYGGEIKPKDGKAWTPIVVGSGSGHRLVCPYGVPGDRLWVQEAFIPCAVASAGCSISEASYVCFRDGAQKFRSSGNVTAWTGTNPPNWEGYRFRSSIHLPRWASRITLEITGVRVERLHEITEEDAEAEGANSVHFQTANPWVGYPVYREGFARLWDKLNAKRGFGWDVNPWVWVVSFRRVD